MQQESIQAPERAEVKLSTSALVYTMFFVSGVASLIYQTVWIRKFSQVLGGTVFSMSVVVSTFMAGLAIGAAVIGRFADRVKRPLVLYALVELGIGAMGVVLAFTDAARAHMVTALIDSPALEGTLVTRVAISVLWLGVPCFLIGGTLPVMVKFVVRRLAVLGQQVGALYFVNTMGAALGALLTGLVIVEKLGLNGSSMLAVAINVSVAAVALVLERLTPHAEVQAGPASAEAPVATSPSAGGRVRVVGPAVAFFFSGFCALVLEMAWTRIVLGFLQSGAVIVSVNLFLVLVGFGLGGAAISRLADTTSDPLRLASFLFAFTALLTVLGLGSVEVLGLGSGDYLPTGIQVGALMGLVLGPSICMGATFPVLVRVLVTSQASLGTQLGSFYALNTIGTVLGGILTPFLLIPTLGSVPSVFLAAGLQLAIAALLGLLAPAGGSAIARFGGAGVALAALVVGLPNWDIYHRTIHEQAMARHPGWATERAYIEGADSTVILYQAQGQASRATQGDDNKFRIQVNASTLVAFDTNETKLMAHLPLVATPDPKRALVICFGVGNTFRSALAHDIDVDVVDINPAIPGLAAIHQKDPSKTFANPRGHIYINDGRNFLQVTKNQYDMVTIDPAPPVWGLGLGNIQSREFYQLISDHLTPNGVAEAWMLSNLDGDFEGTMAAFRQVFPYVQVFAGARYRAFHVLGSKSPIAFSRARLERLFVEPKLRADLGETDISFFSVKLFEQLYITDQEGVDRALHGARPVTDDEPFLEYRTFRGLIARPFDFPAEVRKPLPLVP